MTEVRPDQDIFEDGVGLSVKPIGHGFVGGGGPNTKGGIDSKGEDTLGFKSDERKMNHKAPEDAECEVKDEDAEVIMMGEMSIKILWMIGN